MTPNYKKNCNTLSLNFFEVIIFRGIFLILIICFLILNFSELIPAQYEETPGFSEIYNSGKSQNIKTKKPITAKTSKTPEQDIKPKPQSDPSSSALYSEQNTAAPITADDTTIEEPRNQEKTLNLKQHNSWLTAQDYLSRGELKKAISLLQDITKTDPGNDKAKLLLMKIIAATQPDDAEKIIDTISDESIKTKARYIFAVQMERINHDKALEQYNQILVGANETEFYPLALLNCAKLLLKMKAYTRAAERLKEILKRYSAPKYAILDDAFFYLAKLYQSNSDYQDYEMAIYCLSQFEKGKLARRDDFKNSLLKKPAIELLKRLEYQHSSLGVYP
jgi:tetratricopeptide (TPR) repeat protein